MVERVTADKAHVAGLTSAGALLLTAFINPELVSETEIDGATETVINWLNLALSGAGTAAAVWLGTFITRRTKAVE